MRSTSDVLARMQAKVTGTAARSQSRLKQAFICQGQQAAGGLMAGQFFVVALDPGADRSGFECGVEPLDRYFKTQVGQDIKRRVTACFTALDADRRVTGYYTLASASILLTDLAENLAKKLPRYPNVPAVRIGRLAVDQRYKGKGLGAALLADALRRAAAAEIAAYAFVVDAKDESAADLYAHHGFRATAENPLFLYLPLATVKELVNRS